MLKPAASSRIAPAPYLDDIAEGPEGARAWWLSARDGTRIRFCVFPKGEKGTVLMCPGRTEYIEKYGRLASELAARGYGMAAIDWRGQGLADRPAHRRDMGHVVSFDEYRWDLDAVRMAFDDLDLRHPDFLIGHSMGGAIGLRALYDGLPVRAAAFTAPMWGIRIAPALRALTPVILGLAGPLGFGKSFAPTTGPAKPMDFDDNPLTTDRDQFDYMIRQVATHPELALGGPSTTWLKAALAENRALMAMPAPDVPVLTVIGSREKIVETSAIHDRMATWPGGALMEVAGAEHEVLMEAPLRRSAVIDRICAHFDRHA